MAIAFGSNNGRITLGPGTSLTTGSITVSGSDTYGTVAVQAPSSAAPSSVLWNGVAMSLIASRDIAAGSSSKMYLYGLLGVTTGVITVNFGSSNSCVLHWMYHTGVGGVDATAAANGTGTGTTLTVNFTPTADNCWILAYVSAKDTPGNGVQAGTGSVKRGSDNDDNQLFDNGFAVTPPASTSMGFTQTSSEAFAYIIYAITPTAPLDPPTVDTNAATGISDTGATANGDITDVGVDDPDERGFVFGTTTQGDPGNVAPGSSGYDDYVNETGTFSTGSFDLALSGLTPATTYYVRAYAHNSDGYAYGDEISFDTNATPPWRFENINGITMDETDHKTIWAEKLNDILDRLDALDGGP